ncbi:flagellar hook-associated protein FlgL [Tepidibacillus fermentans]|uniref:Flagellar hook-associated protein 3 FlgL n=1 Tax=Tepidibacillus fermentans TaxID=1281767 RepID=A0A4R3KIE1_9BACI|nr:flagellar hook-associated protein FlgL [Tepidibacillus fermentans]TCS83320.1 flagellar hook-associated protein 3 FlgL [Tepidibacillus fermentans]
MRVTQGMLNNQLLRNLNTNLSRLEVLQNQMATGKRINKPSDDPVGLSFALRYRSELVSNEQYQRNVDSATSWLEYTDKLISETNDVLQRARELAVQGANGTNSDESMEALAMEVEQLYEQLVNIGNSQFNGKYVFNGQKTDQPPYDMATAKLLGTADPDTGKILFEIGTGITIPVNISGKELFGANDATNPNAFQVLEELRSALMNHNQSDVNTVLGKLDNVLDNAMSKWAEVGARSNRVELMKNRLDNENINIQTLLSKAEDADLAEVMINLKMEENIYQASLSTGARIIRPTLVDFLR